MCGLPLIAVYSLDLFRRAKVKYNHYVLSIVTSGCGSLGYVTSVYLTKRISRKIHMVTSGILLAINWAAGGIILYYHVSSCSLFLNYRKNDFIFFNFTLLDIILQFLHQALCLSIFDREAYHSRS